MFNTNILDLIIGLIFIFTIYSLLASSVLELLAGIIGLRGKMLEAALINLFEAKKDLTKNNFRRFFFIFWKLKRGINITKTFSDVFFNSPRIMALNRYHRKSGPSYLNSSTFADNIIDLLGTGDIGTKLSLIAKSLNDSQIVLNNKNIPIDKDLIFILKSFYQSAEGDLAKFKKAIESWFNEFMERVSGSYKRLSKYIILVIGLIIAFSFNVDTIEICRKLSDDPKTRNELLTNASNFVKTYDDKIISKTDSMSVNKLDTLYKNTLTFIQTDVAETNNLMAFGWNKQECKQLSGEKWYEKIVGLLITAFAISLGSGFWFDLLKKMLSLKSMISQPSETAVGRSK